MDSRNRYIRFLLVLTLLLFLLSPASSWAVKEGKSSDREDQGRNGEYSDRVQELVDFLEESGDYFIYRRQNRPDPFMPFLPQKPVMVEKEEIDEKELKGLRKYEPGQLTVVAIVGLQKGDAKAMVQNAAGKGFMVRPGTEIGRYGVVDSISSNVIKVKEKYQMTTGETQTKIVKMLLKKEGEEE